MRLDKRHLISGGDFQGKGVNSVVVNPTWQDPQILESFFKEALTLAKKLGRTNEENVTLANGSTWNINTKDGHFYPVSSTDGSIVNLSRQEMKVLKDATSGGVKGDAIFEKLGKNQLMKDGVSKNMQTALNSLAEVEGVAGAIKLNGFSLSSSVAGTSFLLVGMYQSAQTITTSATPMREGISEGAGWAAAMYGTTSGAVAWSFGGPWGSAIGSVVGGAMGYFVGKNGSDAILNAGSIIKDAQETYKKQVESEGCTICNLSH